MGGGGGPGPKISLGGSLFFNTITGVDLVWGGGGGGGGALTLIRIPH